jgi:hypothetical protein
VRLAVPLGGEGAQELVTAGQRAPGIDLFWLPLGAGGHCVWWNGRIYEAIAARLAGRRVCDLYHSALEVRVPEDGS